LYRLGWGGGVRTRSTTCCDFVNANWHQSPLIRQSRAEPAMCLN
jgi:hypothetical protein